ncbi:DUF3443 family protein [Burkholderia gladioli]|uniref:DUF3443 family protein n=1 Tax=Burkholderia gladioli TaxID=28095 RepID=UPI003F7AA8F6
MLKVVWYLGVTSLVILTSCGGDDSPVSAPNSATPPVVYLDNVQPVRVDRSTVQTATLFSQSGNNRLLTSVTLCSDSTEKNCQTIDNIVVDTGSVGLKVYNYAVADGGASLADERDAEGNLIGICARYASGYAWGRMKVVTLKMAGETARNLPIAVINGAPVSSSDSVVDLNSLQVPSQCSTVNGVSQIRKFRDSNGILGVGTPFSDCGDCAVSTNYFSCASSGSCLPTFLPSHMQTTQPVASFTADNNGLIIQLPNVDNFSVVPIVGQMIFGIGTQSNNQAVGVTAFSLNSAGRGLIAMNGAISHVLVDSGTSVYEFQSGMSVNTNKFYAPSAATRVSATLSGVDSTGLGQNNQGSINFDVIDPASAIAARAVAIGGIATPLADANAAVVLGLPFFFGKRLYFGINGRNSSLGTGPLVAF